MTATIPNTHSSTHTNQAPTVAATSYDLTDHDRDLIAHATQRFAIDYRYLLDMVTTAGKADRATTAKTAPGDDQDQQFNDEVV